MLSPKKKTPKKLTMREQHEADKALAKKQFKASPNSHSNARASKVVGKYKKGGTKGKKK